MRHNLRRCSLMLFFIAWTSQAAPVLTVDPMQAAAIAGTDPNYAPISNQFIYLNQGGLLQKNISLRGIHPEEEFQFNIRRDQLATNATLKLHYTASPSLVPIESQLKIYLNDELMGVITITKEQLGKSTRIELPLDPRYLINQNRLKLSFIGHYNAVCENPANNTIWLDIGQLSGVELTLQALAVDNDLANFPIPFFDELDNGLLKLPMVFPQVPSLKQLKASTILASWFGGKADWRGQSFPVYYNELPNQHAVIFATNTQYPSFIKTELPVTEPTVKMITHPTKPYLKLLLILGKDDNELITAAQGIALGDVLFRGNTVLVNKVEIITPRKPYDAPNWVRTDRPTLFTELQQYPQQLQTSGVTTDPIVLNFNLPPDLYLLQSGGVEMLLKYSYTPPVLSSNSYLNVGINNYYVKSFALETNAEQKSGLSSIPGVSQLVGTYKKLIIPMTQLEPNNQLHLNFEYSVNIGGGNLDGRCESFSILNNQAVIDGSSSVDFSNYYHYIAMPNLNVFSRAGFPYTRMADLSETLIIVNPRPIPEEVSTLLNIAGNIGSQTHYPALLITITNDWSLLRNKSADILIIGSIPQELSNDSQINLLIKQTTSWVKQPLKNFSLPNLPLEKQFSVPNTETVVTTKRPVSAIIEFQSPYERQRSIIALLANSKNGFELLNQALTDNKKKSSIRGSVAIIRESGITSLDVGEVYHVGQLPLWIRVWFILADYPFSMGLTAIITVALLSVLIWRSLMKLSRKRLSGDHED